MLFLALRDKSSQNSNGDISVINLISNIKMIIKQRRTPVRHAENKNSNRSKKKLRQEKRKLQAHGSFMEWIKIVEYQTIQLHVKFNQSKKLATRKK